MAGRYFELEIARKKLLGELYKELAKVVTPVQALKACQLENRLDPRSRHADCQRAPDDRIGAGNHRLASRRPLALGRASEVVLAGLCARLPSAVSAVDQAKVEKGKHD